MPILKIDQTMARIKAAEKSSPIAVFRSTRRDKPELDVFYANTIRTQQMIFDKVDDLVGVFDRHMNESVVLIKLMRAVTE